MSDANKILCDMKDILERRGWTTGRFINAVGECCIMGAWALAEGMSERELMLLDTLGWFKEETNPIARETLQECAEKERNKSKAPSITTPEWLYAVNDPSFGGSKERVDATIECAIEKTRSA